MTELWKNIPGCPGYQASNKGRIRSLPRVVTRVHSSGTVVKQPLKGKVLSPVRCKNGYLYVNIRRKSYQVHRLVAMAWIAGAKPGLDVAHEDGDKLNNTPSNLAWKTKKENMADQLKHGTRLRGEKQNGAKLTAEAVIEMRKLRKTQGLGWIKLSKKFGVTPMTAKSAVLGRTWAHV